MAASDGGCWPAPDRVSALEALQWTPPEEFVVKAADGETDLWGLLYKPYDFDPGRSYPIIDFIYAGSQSAVVPRTFTSSRRAVFAQAMAQFGYLTFVVDVRGTPLRGKDFQDVVYQNIGRHEIPDHVAALRQLAERRPYIDMGRVGVHGYSWGGYFTLRAMLTAPEVFHVGVFSSPVVDLAGSPEPSEPYLGLPQNNREAWDYASNLRLAENLQGKVLLTIGTSDVNTPFAHTMRMIEAFTRAGKKYDLLILPEQSHRLSGASARYWRDAVKDYFLEHLRPA